MRLVIVILSFITTLTSFHVVQAQDVQARHSRYMDHATVRHLDDSATLTANDPRPLAQAVTALSEEYAWVVDFEDPPYYSGYDLVDDTAPQWRAEHPTAKGVTVAAGDSFQTKFPETPNASSPVEEKQILDKVVLDYNASGNPGRFSVRDEGNGRFAIVAAYVRDETGKDEAVTPILDTPISVPEETRNALTTIRVILDALTVKSQTKVDLGTMATNVLRQSEVTVGGQNVPARILLLQALSAAKVRLYWLLFYDHDVKSFALNVLPLRKAEYDASGNRRTVLVP